jgi:hypothetical protein
VQRNRKISGAGTQVKDIRVLALQDMSKATGRSTPPEAIDIQRENVVQEIVARGDLIEHFPHRDCGGALVG